MSRRRRQLRQRAAKKKPVAGLPQPSPHEKYTVDQMIRALSGARGLVAAAAKILGCHRSTVYEYRDKYPQVAEAMETAIELQLDTAELQLFKAIDRGEAWSICFYLKTKGRHRGYVERHEIKGELTVERIVDMIVRKEPVAISVDARVTMHEQTETSKQCAIVED